MLYGERVHLRLESNPASDGVKVYGYVDDKETGKRRAIMNPVIGTPLEHGSILAPLLHLGIPEAQQLFDDLWSAGLRPSKASSNAGGNEHVAAMQSHISDLRDIVSFALNMKLSQAGTVPDKDPRGTW